MTTYIHANTNASKLHEIRRQQRVLEQEIKDLAVLATRIAEYGDATADFEYDPELNDWDLHCATEGCRHSVVPDGSILFLSKLPIGGDSIYCRECKMTEDEKLALKLERSAQTINNDTRLLRSMVQKHSPDVLEAMLEAAQDPNRDPIEVLKKKAAARKT